MAEEEKPRRSGRFAELRDRGMATRRFHFTAAWHEDLPPGTPFEPGDLVEFEDVGELTVWRVRPGPGGGLRVWLSDMNDSVHKRELSEAKRAESP